ncbi:pimeloyl-ACP methyl ester carboxylesterase [Arthrobacter silviterrae]|uniref:Alpha/beta hydrolase n=1 Tax=Arthrobacter silviterrae TaxID=2026658 RepID=A0ABX0DCB4_9MICC|nr:alpha/beta hydrolase [Arthrobacter silviterrae]MDQ0276812.1 pimeloyl-ACP methyl ester carboxylesterase [Arthrobacter silviterrae]NGN83050.1 alpha/beta hydrolase [Arthrobacter silviterrae]
MTKPRIVFVHGIDGFGAAAWPVQHRLAGRYDALFLKRTGFDAAAPPVPTEYAADVRMVLDALDGGAHLVAHAQGAIAAVMAAVEQPGLVKSLVLVEPALLSLTTELPATSAYREHLEPLFSRSATMTDAAFSAEFRRLTASMAGSGGAGPGISGGGAGLPGRLPGPGPVESSARIAARIHLQAPLWEAPVHIVPGVPTLVLTGGWEPLYEEIADYLAATGARHEVTGGGHRPQDSETGAALIEEFIAGLESGLEAGSGDGS